MDWIGVVQNVGKRWFSDDGKETSGCTIGAEFLRYERHCQLLKEILFPGSSQSYLRFAQIIVSTIQQMRFLYRWTQPKIFDCIVSEGNSVEGSPKIRIELTRIPQTTPSEVKCKELDLLISTRLSCFFSEQHQ